eukprot:PITA_19299
MISGYAQNGWFDKDLELFRQMRVSSMKPHPNTFASVLPTCSNLATLEHGRVVHADIIKGGLQPNTFVGNALINLYAKCGTIEDAYIVFDKKPIWDVVPWTTMITGHAIHGHGKEALQLFEQMCLCGIVPNHVIYVSVLSASAHAGLVDDGWHYFDKMNRIYDITPLRENYCCMIYHLGRAEYQSLPQMEEIYGELDRLSGEMEAGYAPDTRFVLNDVEEEQKEHNLSCHSKKLAFAFGLNNTTCGIPITVIKNLRVCGDCHTTMHFIS